MNFPIKRKTYLYILQIHQFFYWPHRCSFPSNTDLIMRRYITWAKFPIKTPLTYERMFLYYTRALALAFLKQFFEEMSR